LCVYIDGYDQGRRTQHNSPQTDNLIPKDKNNQKMNATKFVVLLVIGILCAIVTARQVEEVSKETKLGTSLPKSTNKGIGAQLSAAGLTYSASSVSSSASAFNNPKGPGASASESGYTSTIGQVIAKGRKARVSSASASAATGEAAAAVTRKAAAARAKGKVASASRVKGSSEKKKGKGKKGKGKKD